MERNDKRFFWEKCSISEKRMSSFLSSIAMKGDVFLMISVREGLVDRNAKNDTIIVTVDVFKMALGVLGYAIERTRNQ